MTSNAKEKQIVENYLDAFYRGDAAAAKRYLAENLSFSGPGASYSGAEAFLKASAHAARAVRRVQTRRVLAEGREVCALYELALEGAVPSLLVTEWYQFEGDRITAIRSIFDTGPFRSRGAGDAAGTAIDPVCHMSVEKASAPAMRTHRGTTFYFCNAACAEAFEAAPERYGASSSAGV